MRLPRVQFTVRLMMIAVILFALALFIYELLRRSERPALDKNSGRFLVLVKTFQGPSAGYDAKRLAAELRNRQGLRTYTLARSDFNHGKKGFHRADDSVAVFIGHSESLKSAQATAKMLRRSKVLGAIAGSLRPMPTSNPYLPAPRSSSGPARR
jgi:hypothetical protein